MSNMLIRNPTGDAVRSTYLANDIVKAIVLHNDYTRIRLMTCGTKVIGKQEGAAAKREGAEMQFRILSEGLPVMLPYIAPESVITADLAALKIMMQAYYPICSGFEEPFRSAVEERGERSRAEYDVHNILLICCSLGLLHRSLQAGASGQREVKTHFGKVPQPSDPYRCSLTHDLVLPIWKSNVSVTLMLEKKAKRYALPSLAICVAHSNIVSTVSALSLRIYGEDITTAAREAAQKKRDAPVGDAQKLAAVDDARTGDAEESIEVDE